MSEEVKTKEEGKKEIESTLKKLMKDQYERGIRVGMVSLAKVVMSKVNDSGKSVLDRIEEVKKVCAVPINDYEKLKNEKKEKGRIKL